MFLAALVVLEHAGYGIFGGFAVYTFFIVSGYWIALKWRTEYADLRWPYVTFTLSRFWRLFPAFVITAAVTAYMLDRYEIELFYFFDNPVLRQAWSLGYEARFYIFAPLLVLAFLAPSTLTIGGAAACVVVCLWLFADHYAAACLGAFVLGIAAACLPLKPKTSTASLAVFLSVLFIAMVADTSSIRPILFQIADPSFEPKFFTNSFSANVALTLLASSFTIWTLRLKSNWIDRLLGNLSYTLYLAHYPIKYIYGESPRALLLAAGCAVALLFVSWPFEWLRRAALKWWAARSVSKRPISQRA